MKNDILILELTKTQRCKNDDRREIGPEIRYRRERLSMTLEQLASDICSFSYVSKLENNQLEGNQIYLREICRKLKIDEAEIEKLLSTNKYLYEAIKAFLDDDYNKVKQIYEEILPFYNYKSKIVQFIYHITVCDYVEAASLIKELNKLLGGMSDDDLVYYSSITACFRQRNGDYREALDILDSLGDFNTNVGGINILNEMTRFNSLFMLGDSSIFLAHQTLCNLLSNTNSFYKLERYNYLINVFLIYSGSTYLNLKLFLKDESKKNLFLLKKIKDGVKPTLTEAKEASGMARLLALATIDKKRCLKEFDLYRGLDINMEFNIYIIEYMLLDEEEKYSYIENKIIPIVKANDAFYIRDYFLKELRVLSSRYSKYKLFNLLYSELYR